MIHVSQEPSSYSSYLQNDAYHMAIFHLADESLKQSDGTQMRNDGLLSPLSRPA